MQAGTHVEDSIAADWWSYQTADGRTVTSKVEIGWPRPAADDPNGDWCCPVFLERFTDRVVTIYGVGPVDALMNAMKLVETFADEIGPFAPRAAEPTDEPTA